MRVKGTLKDILRREQDLIKDFKNEVVKADLGHHFNFLHDDATTFNEWGWLAQMQHLGLPTRLIDWTLIPEYALFFALEDNNYESENAVIWYNRILADWDNIMIDSSNIMNNMLPFDISESKFFNISIPWTNWTNAENASGYNNLQSQKGKFLILSNNDLLKSVNEMDNFKEILGQITVPAQNKQKLREELQKINITHEAIYIGANPLIKNIIAKVRKKYGYAL